MPDSRATIQSSLQSRCRDMSRAAGHAAEQAFLEHLFEFLGPDHVAIIVDVATWTVICVRDPDNAGAVRDGAEHPGEVAGDPCNVSDDTRDALWKGASLRVIGLLPDLRISI